ncbi:hypothetical protein B0H14DRAFT_2739596 [Mycena olivaceomarginata]|nr:hypothetical protein B0H14DRAFT_2739596 [Mycena olivaceomarginata]
MCGTNLDPTTMGGGTGGENSHRPHEDLVFVQVEVREGAHRPSVGVCPQLAEDSVRSPVRHPRPSPIHSFLSFSPSAITSPSSRAYAARVCPAPRAARRGSSHLGFESRDTLPRHCSRHGRGPIHPTAVATCALEETARRTRECVTSMLAWAPAGGGTRGRGHGARRACGQTGWTRCGG